MDIDENNDEKLTFLLHKYQKRKNITLDKIIRDKELLKEIIVFLHDENSIKYIDIARVLDVSRTKIFNIKK